MLATLPKKDVPTGMAVEAATVVCDFGHRIEPACRLAQEIMTAQFQVYTRFHQLPGSPHLAGGSVRLLVPQGGTVFFHISLNNLSRRKAASAASLRMASSPSLLSQVLPRVVAWNRHVSVFRSEPSAARLAR